MARGSMLGPSRDPIGRKLGRAARPGFTLLEVIVVLAILAVVAAATAPALRLGQGEPTGLDAATRRLTELFRMARDSAVQGAAPVTVVLDPALGVYWMEIERPGTLADQAFEMDRVGGRRLAQRPLAQRLAPVGLAVPIPLELPPGVRIEHDSRLRFVFRVNGSVFGDSVVVRRALEQRVVHLNPWTGDVVVR